VSLQIAHCNTKWPGGTVHLFCVCIAFWRQLVGIMTEDRLSLLTLCVILLRHNILPWWPWFYLCSSVAIPYVGLVPRPIERDQDGLVQHHTMSYLTVFDLYFIIIISYCHVNAGFELMTGFTGLFDTACDYTLLLHCYTHTFLYPQSRLHCRCLVEASNRGRSPFSVFPNYPRPKLPASHSNSSRRLNRCSPLTNSLTD
jgi:hypothetical protein